MEERIKYLFRQYIENTCTKEELEEFFAYVQEAKNDEQLRNLIKKIYDGIRENSSLTYVDESGNLVLTKPEWLVQQPTQKKSFQKKIIVAGIGAICIITAVGVWFTNRSVNRNREIQKTAALKKKITERSEYKYLLLPDSTQVWLNAVSSLEFPDHFEQNKREVFLSGEAYFDVKHAAETPFIIHTGNISTTVLGTAFNIKAYPDRKTIIVAVSRGKVKVSRGDELVATLTKGQQVKVSNKSNDIATKNISETQVAGWQQGNMVYEDESISDIIADLERMYNVNIRVTDENIRNLKVRTSFKREDGIEHALQILCILTDTKLEQSGGIYTLQ
ncbi:MAG: FecR domain-containing protein [Bacteroidetes bacterium]|nr:FecR domain-containing protein [Bacteroidota bacterium]